MTTARAIITSALTLRLNRLAAGETLDADLSALCLVALNEVIDENNGSGLGLWREVFTTSAPISGVSGTIGSTWPGLVPCCNILGASYKFSGLDEPMAPITMAQYQDIQIKTLTGLPTFYAYDGQATVFFYSAATGQAVTLRTRQDAAEFVDLDTDYTVPKGYTGHLASLVAEKVALPVVGGLPSSVARSAAMARRAMSASVVPAILNSGPVSGRLADFLSGI